MKIVYFQGWGEHFDESKFKIFSKFGDEVFYPEINYQNSRNIINSYVNEICRDDTFSLIVGDSIGAYISFHISNIINRPSLLINPTFFLKNGVDLKPSHRSTGDVYKDKKVILSSKNDEIDFKRTLKFVSSLNLDEEIKIYNDFSQKMPLDILEIEFSEFREKYKDLERKEKERRSKSNKKETNDFFDSVAANPGEYWDPSSTTTYTTTSNNTFISVPGTGKARKLKNNGGTQYG